MLVEQAEIHRRIRAAMILAGASSWERLAELTGYSRTTVKDLGTPRKVAEHKHVVNVAAALGVAYEWFTVPSIQEAVEAHARHLESERQARGEPGPTDEERREEDGDDGEDADAPGA